MSCRQRAAMGAGTVYDALEEILIPQSFVVDRAAVLAEKRRSGLLEAQHPFLKKGEMMSAPGDESCLVWPQELPCRTSWVEKGHALCSLGDRLTLPEAMANPRSWTRYDKTISMWGGTQG